MDSLALFLLLNPKPDILILGMGCESELNPKLMHGMRQKGITKY